MLVSLKGRFAYLAMTKTGSTSVENAIRPKCNILFTRDHRVTHMPAHQFDAFVRPYLDAMGFEGIETLAQVRHPVSWLDSWWRYRSKPAEGEQTLDSSGVSFDVFAREFIEGADRPYLQHIHRPRSFYCDARDQRLVDILFRFEAMDAFSAFLGERLGAEIRIPKHNASPKRFWSRTGRETRAALEQHFDVELSLWEQAHHQQR